MTLRANWSYPNQIRFGAGRIAEIGKACCAAGIEKPLMVTDRGLAALPITAHALNLMEEAGLGRAVFSEVDPNPDERNMEAGLRMFREGGHDGVVLFGGGSALDLGKMIALMCGQNCPVWDFDDSGDGWKRAEAAAIAPMIAVPTTAGTGSEVGRAGVLTNSETHQKIIIFHPSLLPHTVIADPEMTVGMPKAITIGTGMDALAHCIEAYSSPHFHPMSHGIALEGMRLVRENLPQVVDNPDDIEARGQMMAAAMMGAVGFQKGLGAVHAMSHPIGALYNTHHGMTNAVVLPPVLRMNRPEIEDKLARAAAYLGLPPGFDGFYDWIMDFRAQMGVPERLSALGVGPERIDDLVRMALADPSTGGNPVEMAEDNTRALFEAAI